jgi:hypothetical protein
MQHTVVVYRDMQYSGLKKAVGTTLCVLVLQASKELDFMCVSGSGCVPGGVRNTGCVGASHGMVVTKSGLLFRLSKDGFARAYDVDTGEARVRPCSSATRAWLRYFGLLRNTCVP